MKVYVVTSDELYTSWAFATKLDAVACLNYLENDMHQNPLTLHSCDLEVIDNFITWRDQMEKDISMSVETFKKHQLERKNKNEETR